MVDNDWDQTMNWLTWWTILCERRVWSNLQKCSSHRIYKQLDLSSKRGLTWSDEETYIHTSSTSVIGLKECKIKGYLKDQNR